MSLAPCHYRLVFCGPPGVGKGTFANKICQTYLGLNHVSTGDLFRQHLSEKTPIGLQAESYLNSGKLVPDHLTKRMLSEYFENHRDKGYILDGYPRTEEQAKLFFSSSRDLPDLVINITIDREVLIEKIAGRRLCADCNKSYNIANIIRGSFNMPALLPQNNPLFCDDCNGSLISRADDEMSVVRRRLQLHDFQEDGVIKWFKSRKLGVIDFPVTRGISQTEELVDVIKSYLD